MSSSAIHLSDVGALIKEVKKSYKNYLIAYDLDNPEVIVNNSGGKDSGATDLLAMAILGDNYRSVAADTGNEHPLTIEHLKSLHEQRGGKSVEIVSASYSQEAFDKRRKTVEKQWLKKQKIMAGTYKGIIMPSLGNPDTKFSELWRNASFNLGWGEYETALDAFRDAFVRSGNPFLDMCLLHGGFPLGRQRFCTDELKINVVMDKVITPILENDHDKEIVQWSGVRADESDKRSRYQRFSEDERNPEGRLFNFLPIHRWSSADVFAIYKYFGVEPNPLYKKGMGRVGCMPCILVKKEELAEIAARFPSEIERVERWEKQVAKVSRWMHWMIVGHVNRRQFIERSIIDGKQTRTYRKLGNNIKFKKGYQLDVEAYRGSCMLGPRGGVAGTNIHEAIEWSKTGRGGKVYDLVTACMNAEVCSSKYGLCG